MSQYQLANSPAPSVEGRPRAQPAPGKRTRTEALVPRATNLDANLDPIVEPNETRSAIERALPAELLSSEQIERAQLRNPVLIRRQRFSPHLLSTADLDSAAFAIDVAEKQAAAGGIKVDGIAGPITLQTLFGPRAKPAAKPTPVQENSDPSIGADGLRDTRATIEDDDPFGSHLIGR